MMENKTIDFLNEVEALAKKHDFSIDTFSYESFPRSENGVPLSPNLNIEFLYKGDK